MTRGHLNFVTTAVKDPTAQSPKVPAHGQGTGDQTCFPEEGDGESLPEEEQIGTGLSAMDLGLL